MKILLAPDLHCYYSNYGRVLSTGEHSRLAEWKAAGTAMLAAARAHGVDLAVFPGDFYPNAKPTPAQELAVGNLLNAFEDAGIGVVGCPGNHDLAAIGQPGPVDVISGLVSRGNFSTAPKLDSPDPIIPVQVAFLPSVKPATLNAEAANPAEAAQKLSIALIEIARGLRAQCREDQYKILVGHWTVSGAITSSDQPMYGGTEPVLALNDLLEMGWDAVLLGHIHKPQVLHERPFVGYAGALQRVNFGEEHDPRGCWIVDLEAGTHEWVDLPAQEFCTLDAHILDITGAQVFVESLGLPGESCPDYRGKITRVKYITTEDVAKHVDHAQISRTLQANGAEIVAGIYPEIARSDRTRESSVTESTGPVEALGKWMATRNVAEGLRDRVACEVVSLLREVAS